MHCINPQLDWSSQPPFSRCTELNSNPTSEYRTIAESSQLETYNRWPTSTAG